jgi:erythromycin esterase-like protein
MKMLRFLVVSLLLSNSLFGASKQNKDVVDWMRSHAVPLETSDAGHGFRDLQPLKKIIGSARIVSLGEATHGTHEFFQMKHRMLEFLATQMGFTIFTIEANMPEAYRLNDYVLNGNGDPVKLLKDMHFWIWDTQEVLEMIRWMREFNKSGKGRVEFTGFDMQYPEVAMGIVHDFMAKTDVNYLEALEQAEKEEKASLPTNNQAFGVATFRFPVKEAAGKTIRFSGYIKTKDVRRGWAGLWWRVDGSSGTLAFDNMQDRGVTGTTDWKRYELELPVATDATNINFGAIFNGQGTAWFDDLTVDVGSVPYTDKSEFDLSFEQPTVKGFYTGGIGYSVQLDNQVVHSGRQSLQMRYVAPPADSGAVDPKAAGVSWKGVIAHMAAARAGYVSKGPSPQEIDWAIQNARVVLQSIQLQSGEVPRDQSMAENIKWIADQNPGAKIVVWAHNGHVAFGGWPGYTPMGQSLREMFGNQVVTFGFAFDHGSFQAVEQGHGQRLRNFTVPPAPADGLDAMLAATGIPLFALDMRQLPKSGPVAGWMHTPRKVRAIGAWYSEEKAGEYFVDQDVTECYDVLLFVENTTAARKNP